MDDEDGHTTSQQDYILTCSVLSEGQPDPEDRPYDKVL
jgi:hypothetical protein